MEGSDKILFLNSELSITLKNLCQGITFKKYILFSPCENRSPFVVFVQEDDQV